MTRTGKLKLYSLSDYKQMFMLNALTPSMTICDYLSGLSSVNAELQAQGIHAVSADPLYEKSKIEMHAFVASMSPDLNSDEKVNIAQRFLADYEKALDQRYVLPTALPDKTTFSLLLFVLSDNQSVDFNAFCEFLKLAQEVRVFFDFACVDLLQQILPEFMLALQQNDVGVELKQVHFNGANDTMLRLWSKTCLV